MIHQVILLQASGFALSPTTINMVMIGGMILVMYLFLLRPQQKKANEQKDFLKQLKKGDRVVTIGGVHGRIIKDNEDTLLIEVDNNVKLKIERTAVSMENTKKVADTAESNGSSAGGKKDAPAPELKEGK